MTPMTNTRTRLCLLAVLLYGLASHAQVGGADLAPRAITKSEMTEPFIRCSADQDIGAGSTQIVNVNIGWGGPQDKMILELTTRVNRVLQMRSYRIGPTKDGSRTAFKDYTEQVFISIDSNYNMKRTQVPSLFTRKESASEAPIEEELDCNLLFKNFYPTHFVR